MSSLGYVIVLLFCPADGSGCELSKLRVHRIPDLAQCEAQLSGAAALAASRNASETLGTFSAVCRNLEELCAMRAVSLPRSIYSAQAMQTSCRRPRFELTRDSSPELKAGLAFVCSKPLEGDCGG